MDAGVEATQERLPDVRSKSPAQAHGLAGRDVRQAPSGVSFSLDYFSFAPGILPFALRASFAVRARILHARGQAKEK
jgi:hypothetical protein